MGLPDRQSQPNCGGRSQDWPRHNSAARAALLKQSDEASASFLADTPVVACGYLHPLVQDAFTDAILDAASLFTGPQRAGLSRGETALLRLLKRKAEK